MSRCDKQTLTFFVLYLQYKKLSLKDEALKGARYTRNCPKERIRRQALFCVTGQKDAFTADLRGFFR